MDVFSTMKTVLIQQSYFTLQKTILPEKSIEDKPAKPENL